MAASNRRDLYDVLGVPRHADAEAIRTAYRKLARQYHPDVNPDDAAAEARFKEVSEAYAVLSNPDKKALYDEFGPVSLEGGFDADAARRARDTFGGGFGGAAQGGPFGGGGFGGMGGIEDMIENLFGGGGGRAGRDFAMRGADLEATLELEFLEAARGCERTLSVSRPAADGSVRQDSVTVRIPAGVDDGGRIRLSGKGGAGSRGGPPGDLYARIRVRPHPWFRREGRDLHVDLPVTVREAVLGAQVEIPTLDGRATVTVPPGTDSGRRLRLRGKGIPSPKGGAAGDLYATVQIRVPTGLDAEARAKLAELDAFDIVGIRKEWDG